MNTYLSSKLTFFSFWLIILVVVLHSLNVYYPGVDTFFSRIQFLISFKLSQIAVPLFFMISGYLYFIKVEVNKKIDYSFFKTNNIKRIKTVVLPYFAWCALGFLFLFIIQLLPITRDFFSQPLYKMSVKDILLNLFYYPSNFPLWFLRVLIVLFLVSPLILISVKYLKWIFPFAILIFALIFKKLLWFGNINLLPSIPFFYFSLGAYLALRRINLKFKGNIIISILLVVCWMVFNILSLYNDKYIFIPEEYIGLFLITKDLMGCFAVWYSYDYFNKTKQWKNYNFYQYSFFIFVFHGIPTLLLVKLSIAVFKDNVMLLFLAYILIIPFMVTISILLAKGLEKLAPAFYKILTGSRN